MVTATDGSHQIKLLEPDAALQGVGRASVREVQWQEDGRVERGGLILPLGSSPKVPVPLVIQAYAWIPDQFLPDGTATSSYAAQALASQGVAVLLMNIPTEDGPDLQSDFNYPDEGPAFVRRIDAAVQALTEDGAIDKDHVGLIGFSRGGYLTYYAVTHPGKTKIAAAVVADAWTGSFDSYTLYAAFFDDADGAIQSERQYGRGTFWQNKKAWLEQAPNFNVDRLEAPVLFTLHGPAAPFFAHEIIGSFRLNRRPYEMLFFPRGTHQLQMPREREVSLQSTVDWIRFWLQGREDSSPRAAERMLRWRRMRELRNLKIEKTSTTRK
jgi:dipeptidyl aminopeptidase/acylaminoacyl peptidase